MPEGKVQSMDEQMKTKVIRAALLAAMSGITLAEATAVAAQPATSDPHDFAAASSRAFVRQGSGIVVNFIKHPKPVTLPPLVAEDQAAGAEGASETER
jgi:hypothetical protein